MLLQHGAHVDEVGPNGRTLLQNTVAATQETVASRLIDHNAGLYAGEEGGITPTTLAITQRAPQAITLLIDAGAVISPDDTPLMEYLRSRLTQLDENTIPALAKVRFDLSRMPELDQSLLVKACFSGTMKTIQGLVTLGLSINRPNTAGDTPLHAACARGNSAIVSWLIDREARLDAQDHRGDTPLHTAIRSYHSHVVGTLVSRSQANTISNGDGLTPWQLAQDIHNWAAQLHLPMPSSSVHSFPAHLYPAHLSTLPSTPIIQLHLSLFRTVFIPIFVGLAVILLGLGVCLILITGAVDLNKIKKAAARAWNQLQLSWEN